MRYAQGPVVKCVCVCVCVRARARVCASCLVQDPRTVRSARINIDDNESYHRAICWFAVFNMVETLKHNATTQYQNSNRSSSINNNLRKWQ